MIIKDQPIYTEYSESTKNCKFRIDGKLRTGKVISEWKSMGLILVGYYDGDTSDCNYKEKSLPKNKVKLLLKESKKESHLEERQRQLDEFSRKRWRG